MSESLGQMNDNLSQNFLNEPSLNSSNKLEKISRATQNSLLCIAKLKTHEVLQ